MDQNGCFCMPFLVVALCPAPTAFAGKQNWQSGYECHISHHCYMKSICLLQRVCWTIALCFMYKLLGIGHMYQPTSTFSHVNEASKHLCVSAIDRYATFLHRGSLMQACKVRSEPSWSGMGTHGSTMMAAQWKLNKAGWKMRRVTGFHLWTTPPNVNAVCMELTKCKSMRAV